MQNFNSRIAVLFSAVMGSLLVHGCIASDSPVLDVTEGCDEFRSDEALNVDGVNPIVGRFMVAAADFSKASTAMKGDVLTACANVATDLGAQDTWSGLGDVDDAITNDQGTGACDVAGSLVEEQIHAARSANVDVALSVSEGSCRYDFDAQAACDAQCSAEAVCDSGSVETRCEPGSLSVLCQASCTAGSQCMGRPELPASCMGVCESTCQGQCAGTCIGEDGKRTENDANCRGKCSSSCNGTCRGVCRVDAPEGVACGIDVRCTGSCSGAFTEPVCTSEFTPPSCTVDASCHAACSANVAAHATCDPPIVELFADVSAAPELQPVIDTLERNLPALLHAAEQQGNALVAATRELVAAGEDIRGRIEELDGHSAACLGTASLSLGNTLIHFDVVVTASARVSATVRSSSI